MAEATSFDHVYESEPTFEAVYARIVEELVAAAEAAGEVLYAVPGSPAVAERTVELLGSDPRVEVEIAVAVSFADLVWARLGVDPVEAGVRMVDGRRFGVEAAGERGPLLVAQCDSVSVLSDIKLAVEDGPAEVTVLQRLGLVDESVFSVTWDELDRSVKPDHLTSLYLPALAAPVAGELARFAELVRVLRDRCPWDREQTHRSLTRHLLEEAYELLEAIESLPPDDEPERATTGGSEPEDGWDHLQEELGDVLFQVAFHATLAAESGHFTLADVARGVHDKLVARHPHVFGDVTAGTAQDVAANWERNKMAEKNRSSLMEGIPSHLPALLFALKVARRAANAGAPVTSEGTSFPGSGPDLGAELFGLVEGARRRGVDPEAALRTTAAAFRDRFMATEALAGARGLDLHDLDPEAIARLWDEAGAC